MSRHFMTLRDALLVFWRTVISVGCQAQTSIVTQFEAHNFDSEEIRDWLKKLYDAREAATLTPDQCFLIQHEQLIMEQLGISDHVDPISRCTLSALSKMIFNFDGVSHRGDEQCRQNRYEAEELRRFAHCYFTLSASHNSDLYLNVAFGLLLSGHALGKEYGFCYNSDAKNMFQLACIQLVRGSVENSRYCTSICALSSLKDHHTVDCQSRGTVWLLLTFANREGQKRQIHFDVASSAYGRPTFFNLSHPLPCAVGFIPTVDDQIRKRFDDEKWPFAKIPRITPPENVASYRISAFDCVLPLNVHYLSVVNIEKNFASFITDENRRIVSLWHDFRHATQTKRRDEEKKCYDALVAVTSVEHAMFLAEKFMHYVDANTEAVSLRIFIENLRNYDLILKKMSGEK